MKIVVLTTTAVLMLCGFATAHESAAEPSFRHDNPAIRLAMGPTSASQRPGGTGQQSSSSNCSTTSGSCPTAHKKIKHPGGNPPSQ